MKKRAHPTYPDVWAAVARIPRGKVATYGQIAEILDIPDRARFVGYALHALPPGSPVPWHRVVNARGQVSLRGDPGRTQAVLLENEGVGVPQTGIDLVRKRWKPAASRRSQRRTARSKAS